MTASPACAISAVTSMRWTSRSSRYPSEGGHLPDLHLPEGQAVEHDGAAGGRPFDGLRLAAPLERGLVDRPVEGGVALGCGRAGLGVDLLQHYARGDGRLFRREGVVVVGETSCTSGSRAYPGEGLTSLA